MKREENLFKRREQSLAELTDQLAPEVAGSGSGSNSIDELVNKSNQKRDEIEQRKETSNTEEEELERQQDNNLENNEEEESNQEEEVSEDEERLNELEAKETLTEEEQAELDEIIDRNTPLIEKIKEDINSLGYEIEGDYPDDTEGIIALAKDVAAKEINNSVAGLHNASPLLSQLYDHVVNKGLSEELFAFQHSEPEHGSFNLEEETGQEQLAAYYYKQIGLSEEESNELIESFKNQGKLKQKVASFKSVLDQARAEEVAAIEKQENEAKAAQKELETKIQQEINQTLQSGNLQGYQIPKEDLNGFKDFIYSKNNEGVAKSTEAYVKATTPQKMLIDYLLYKNFDVPAIDLKKEIKRVQLKQQADSNKTRKLSFSRASGKTSSKNNKKSLRDILS